jgi:predicted phage tail protein
MEGLREIRLLGAAGRRFGRVFHLAVESPAEAVRALCSLFPEFRTWVLQQHDRGVAWRVVIDRGRCLEADDLTRGTNSSVIVFAPILMGAGGAARAIVGIVIGVFLIAVSFGAFGISTWLLLSASQTTSIGLLGASLVLSGVAQLLTPTPKAPSTVAATREADLQSNLFSRNQGTDGQGECVPLLYGRRRVQSPRLISFNLRNFPNSRNIYNGGTAGLLGYVNRAGLY